MNRTVKRMKVDGGGRQWHVWQWSACWNIIAGPFLTKRRAIIEMRKLR